MIWISLIILLTYMIYAGVTVGITPTLSESFYKVKQKWAFTLGLVGAGMLLLPEWLECGTQDYQFLAFFACAALCFIGCAPAFKEGMDRKVHVGGLIVCLMSLIAWCIVSGLWPVLIFFGITGFLLSLVYPKYWRYIMECSAFASAYFAVFASDYLI